MVEQDGLRRTQEGHACCDCIHFQLCTLLLLLSAVCAVLVDTWKQVCCGCGKTHTAEAAKMLKCDRCAVARFCSQHCQQANWREHRKECFYATKEMLSTFHFPEMVVQTIHDPEELEPLPHDEGGQLHAKAIQRHRMWKEAQRIKDDDFEFQRQIRQCSRLTVQEAVGWAAVGDHVGAAAAYQSGTARGWRKGVREWRRGGIGECGREGMDVVVA